MAAVHLKSAQLAIGALAFQSMQLKWDTTGKRTAFTTEPIGESVQPFAWAALVLFAIDDGSDESRDYVF